MSRIRFFLSLPFWDQLLLLEAAVLLLLVRPVVNLHMKYWSRFLGTARAETPTNASPEKLEEARRIRWAVEAISSVAFWRADCLPQAMTARLMLNRRGIASTLYLGAAYKGDELEAHAWLRVGQVIVTGRAAHQRFRVVLMYASQAS